MRKIIVSGRLGKDSEIRTTKNGTVFLSAFLISTEFGDPKDEAGNPLSMVFSVFCTDSRSIGLQRFLVKGKPVIVTGELRVREYVKENGTKGISYDINHAYMDFVPFTAKKDENEEGDENGSEKSVPEPEIGIPNHAQEHDENLVSNKQEPFPPAPSMPETPAPSNSDYNDDLPF